MIQMKSLPDVGMVDRMDGKGKQQIVIGRRLLHIYMKMKKVKITIKELYDAMRPNVYRNKKKYTRKSKHKKKDADS